MSNAGAGGPGAGGDQGGFLQWLQGLAPQAQSAIMRVMAQANPVQPAAAADSVQRAPNPLNNPSPVPPALAAGGPPVPAGAVPPMGTPPIGGGPGMAMDPKGFTGIVPGGGNAMDPKGFTGTPAAAAPIARVRAHINPRATALAPAAPGGALPGYYAPTTGNARGSTWSPYTDPNDPRIFRGPLAR